jgi:hypothetical protein
MTPYLPFADEEKIVIAADKVVTCVKPKKEILASYQKNTSSIITTGSPNLITETKLPKLDK